MMPFSKPIEAEYCGFYIAGSIDAKVPFDAEAPPFWVSEDCILVVCLPGQEGETQVSVEAAQKGMEFAKPAFDGLVNTPARRLHIWDVNNPDFFSTDVAGKRTRIRIWTNWELTPDEVRIVVG